MLRSISLVFLFLYASLFGHSSVAAVPAPVLDEALGHPAFIGFTGIARVTRGDDVLFELAQGTDLGGQPINASTQFWIGSVSKQFVGASVVRLASQGKIKLSDRVASHIPGWPEDALRRDGVDCTIELLLSHQCGIPSSLGRRYFFSTHDPGIEAEYLEFMNGSKLKFTPGTDRSYSNEAFDLGGILVSKVTGMPLEEFLKQTFFEEFGIRETGVRTSDTPGYTDRFAVGHLASFWGPVRTDRWLNLPVGGASGIGASGNIHSTALELELWTRALFRDGGLTPDEVENLTKDRREDRRYGLGIAKRKRSYGYAIMHNGALTPEGYSSLLAYVPETDTTVVVLQNQDLAIRNPDDLADALLLLAHGISTDDWGGPEYDFDWFLARLMTLFFVGVLSPVLPIIMFLSAFYRSAKEVESGRLAFVTRVIGYGWMGIMVSNSLNGALAFDVWVSLCVAGSMAIGLHRRAGLRRYKNTSELYVWIGISYVFLPIFPYLLGFAKVHFVYITGLNALAWAMISFQDRRAG